MLLSSRQAWFILGVWWLLIPIRHVFASIIMPGSSSSGRTYSPSAQVVSAHQLRYRDVAPLYHSATSADIAAARAIVKESIAKASVLNKARLDRPARNNYHLKPDNSRGPIGPTRRGDDADDAPPPLLRITHEIAKAAALVAEADAMANFSSTSTNTRRSEGRYWMESMTRTGSHPIAWGGSTDYKVCYLSFSYLGLSCDWPNDFSSPLLTFYL